MSIQLNELTPEQREVAVSIVVGLAQHMSLPRITACCRLLATGNALIADVEQLNERGQLLVDVGGEARLKHAEVLVATGILVTILGQLERGSGERVIEFLAQPLSAMQCIVAGSEEFAEHVSREAMSFDVGRAVAERLGLI